MNPEQFEKALLEAKIAVSPHQLAQFQQYFEMLVSVNQQLNLTSITAEPEVYLKHFYDSVIPAFSLTALQSTPLSLCDVGAGAGFPSIPLKIMFPQLQVTIIDSLNKRINFLQDLVELLQLDGVTLIHSRAETFGAAASEFRESFDVVTARAVARLSVLSEFCLPLVKVGGTFIALKSTQTEAEVAEGQFALTTLGGQISRIDEYQLPLSGEPRSVILIDKVAETPDKYPRRPGVPVKKPLQAKK